MSMDLQEVLMPEPRPLFPLVLLADRFVPC